MEITELNLIGDFEAGIKCLQQNPSYFTKLSINSFWTWGALIFAIFATFSNLFNKIKYFVHKVRLNFVTSCQKTCQTQIFFDDEDFDFDFSSDDGVDDDTPSSVADSDYEYESESERGLSNEVFRAEGGSSYYDQGQNGNYTLRRRNGFSWSDFSAGKSVVQLWDSFGLGLDFEDDEYDHGSEVAVWDLDKDLKISSGRRCAVVPAAESVVLTAEMSGVGFRGYDESPVYTAWRPQTRATWVDEKEE